MQDKPHYVEGDPDDHEVVNAVASLYWPSKLGCTMWLLTAAAVETTGLYIFGRIDPDFTHKLSEWWAPIVALSIAALGSGPAISFSYPMHLDADHYTHTTDHVHVLPALVKAVINTGISIGHKIRSKGK